MRFSAELRWFHPGPIPGPTMDWFTGNRPLTPEERVDRYLVLPGSESVGIKIRGGGQTQIFEVKAMRGAPETVQLPMNVSGRTDSWVKWSYNRQPVRALVRDLMREREGWIHVAKKRWQRQWSLDGGRHVEVDTWEMPDEGCRLELTRLVAGVAEWWTVGFESFGELENLRGNLLKAAIHFLSHHPPVDRFDTTNSCSYPVWLAGL